MFHRHEYSIVALHVQEGFLLASKRGVRHIFRRGGGTHGEGGVGVIGGQLVIGFVNSLFQFALERSVDDPLADLRAGFRQSGNVVNIGVIQQLINLLVM